jgi:hypothetical protein
MIIQIQNIIFANMLNSASAALVNGDDHNHHHRPFDKQMFTAAFSTLDAGEKVKVIGLDSVGFRT